MKVSLSSTGYVISYDGGWWLPFLTFEDYIWLGMLFIREEDKCIELENGVRKILPPKVFKIK